MQARLFFIALLNFWLIGRLQSQNTLAMPAVQNFDKRIYQAGVQNWDIQQDKKGNIYAANNEGLLVYDGSRWQLYPIKNGTIVRSVCIHPQGRIYVGGQDEIGYFEANDQGRLVYQSLTSLIPASFAAIGDVWDIVCKGNSVFFRSFNGILHYQDPVIVGYRPKSEWQFMGLAGTQLIAQDVQNGLMVFQNNGWYPIELSQRLPSNALVTALMPYSTGEYLLTTLKHGLFKWSANALTPWATQAINTWQQNRIYHATVLSNQRFALASSVDGLFVIDRNGNTIQHLAKSEGLQNNNVLHVFSDRQENLWLGLDNGIDCIAFNSAIRQINPRLEDGAGYAALQYKQQLYVGTTNGLYQVGLESGSPLDFARGEFRPIPGMSGQIWSLSALNNQILIGHHEGATALQDNTLMPLSRETGHWAFLPQSETYPTERIIAGNYKGLSVFQYQQNRFLPLGFLPNFNESSRFIAIDADQQIWVSHPYHGTFRIRQKEDGKAEAQLFSQKEGLPSDLNTFIFKIRQEILAATDKGVYRYNRQTQRFTLAADYQKWLGGKSIRYLREDLKGNVWFVHEKQVGVLDFSTPEPKRLELPELTRKILSGFEMIYPYDETHVIIGAEKGFFLVNLEQYKKASKALGIQIRGVHLFDQKDSLVYGGYQTDSSQAIVQAQSIAPHWKSIRFEYASAVYPADQSLEYSYRLYGFDNQWSAWGDRTEKEYTNLPKGKYRFEVKSRKSEDSESTPVSYTFEVLPPWHQSNIAISLYLIAGLLGSGFLYRYQQKKFKRQTRRYELEQERLRYIYDLERTKAESELVTLRNEKLESEIQYKNAEMAASALHLVQKGELMSTMKEELSRLMKVIDQPKAMAEIKNIVKRLSDDENFEQEWDQFSKYFDKVHSDFVTELKQKHPSLTPSESKLCIYLRMNLSTKEIAQLLNISVRGVEISRYRLRKKLQLPTERNLSDYLSEIKQD